MNKPENVREFAAGKYFRKIRACRCILSYNLSFKDYFTDPNLNEKVNLMNKERERKFEVNKMIQDLKTQNLNK